MRDRCGQEPAPEDSAIAARAYRVALLNPNTSTAATTTMVESASRAAVPGVSIEGRTVADGKALIADPVALAQAALAVEVAGPALVAEGFDAIIVAGFGDPGVAALRERLSVPVIGLGEAGIAEAARDGLLYAIVTVTPGLHQSLVAAAHAQADPRQFVGVRYTQGQPDEVMQTPEDLAAALLVACQEAIAQAGAQSIVIGGGPLAGAAPALANRLSVRIVDPVGAAVRLVCQRMGLAGAVTV